MQGMARARQKKALPKAPIYEFCICKFIGVKGSLHMLTISFRHGSAESSMRESRVPKTTERAMGHRFAEAQNDCNCTALRKASRRVSQLYDEALAPCGLRVTQLAI